MTNQEIAALLHKMVDRWSLIAAEPLREGTVPLLRITLQPDDDNRCLRLTVGVDYVERDSE